MWLNALKTGRTPKEIFKQMSSVAQDSAPVKMPPRPVRPGMVVTEENVQ